MMNVVMPSVIILNVVVLGVFTLIVVMSWPPQFLKSVLVYVILITTVIVIFKLPSWCCYLKYDHKNIIRNFVNTIPILTESRYYYNLKFFVISRPAVFCFVVEYILQHKKVRGSSPCWRHNGKVNDERNVFLKKLTKAGISFTYGATTLSKTTLSIKASFATLAYRYSAYRHTEYRHSVKRDSA